MQGINEILAPILTIRARESNEEPSSPGKEKIGSNDDDIDENEAVILSQKQIRLYRINLLMFESLIKKLCPATFASKGVNALQSQLTSFHLILTYHDPILAMFLRER